MTLVVRLDSSASIRSFGTSLTDTLYAESDEMLDQHARYALFVKRGVRDVTGNLGGPSEEFRRFRHAGNPGQSDDWMTSSYRGELITCWLPRSGRESQRTTSSSRASSPRNPLPRRLNASVIRWMLRAGGRRLPARVRRQSNRVPLRYDRRDHLDQSNTYRRFPSRRSDRARFVPAAGSGICRSRGIRQVRFTELPHSRSDHSTGGTRVGSPSIQSWADVYFNVYIPSGTPPPAGWPVAIFGHGRNGDKNFSMRVAATMASRGIATVSINAVGHGFGPYSALSVTRTDGTRVTFLGAVAVSTKTMTV